MIKLLICLCSGIAISLFTLNLRHKQLELRHQHADLHDRINALQSKLWNQQLQIATFTAPNSIGATVKGQKIDMVPRYAAHASWTQPLAPQAEDGR
jgi:hypothetical protein